MTNKINVRKNKTKLEVKWPSSYFTIDSLHKENSQFVNITLRVRLKTAIDDKKVSEIGILHVGKGRPKLVFAMTPVADAVVQSAREAGVMLHSAFDSVPVTTVSSDNNQSNDKVTAGTDVAPTPTATKVNTNAV